MLHFTSYLSQVYQDELERLMFFNSGQQAVHATIEQAIERFGSPTITVENGKIKILMNNLIDAQSLFTLINKKLVAVMIYSRLTPETITVIHVAIDEDYTAGGRYAQRMVMLRQLAILRKSAQRIRGVRYISLAVGKDRFANVGLSRPYQRPSSQ